MRQTGKVNMHVGFSFPLSLLFRSFDLRPKVCNAICALLLQQTSPQLHPSQYEIDDNIAASCTRDIYVFLLTIFFLFVRKNFSFCFTLCLFRCLPSLRVLMQQFYREVSVDLT